MQSLTYSKPGQTLFSLSYGYVQNGGNNGQITSITDNLDATRSMTYSYDPLGRLKVAFAGPEANPTWKLDWDYDRYGNRPNQNVRAGSPPGPQLTIDPATNRVTGTGYSYDADGNMTADGLNSLAYDAENRVVSMNGGANTYSYDGSGLRVKKQAGSTTTVYLFSGTKVIAEYENGAALGAPTREYIYSGVQMLAKIEGGTTTYYHADHLSARLMTDGTPGSPTFGEKNGERGHYPFGETWYETGSGTTKWKFTTYERDAESLNDYAMARYHINRIGRFSSPDPIAGSIADPQSLNRYAYVRNDPVDFVDPLGLLCSWNINEQGQWVIQCTVYAVAEDRFFLEWAACAYLGICRDGGSQGGDPDPGRDRGDREPEPQPQQPDRDSDELNPFAAAVFGEVWNRVGFIAQPTCGGGAFIFAGGGGRIPGTPLKAEALAIPISYDSRQGFSSGFIGEVGPKGSPFSTGVELSYNWQTGKGDVAGLAFINSNWQSAKLGTISAGVLIDGNNNTFGLYAGKVIGGGFYMQPSFLGPCK